MSQQALSEEPDTFSSSDSEPPSPPALRSATGLAAVLQAKLNKKPAESGSKPGCKPGDKPPPPPTHNKKTLMSKPTLPKPVNSGPSPRDSDSQLTSDVGDSSSSVSNLASVLKSKFESRQMHGVSTSNAGEAESGKKKGALPSKPLMPSSSRSSGGKPDTENGVTVKPIFPVKPVIGTKDTVKKPELPSNKPVPLGKPKLDFGKVKKPSVPPPNVPSNPPRFLKKAPKDEADSNNNADPSKQTGSVSGIAAAMKSKFENTELNKFKSKPNLPALPSGGTNKPGKINSNWKAANASKPTNSNSTEEELKSLKNAKPVGDLVSTLSGKLNFAADKRTRSHSAEFTQDPKLQTVTSGERLKPQIRSSRTETYTAISGYTAQGDGELSMEEGEQFAALDKTDSGWWQVRRPNGEEGWVPASYLTVEEGGAVSQTNTQYTSDRSSADRPDQTTVTNKAAEQTQITGQSKSTTRVQYKTVAMFTAENPGEVGFDEGEVVEVLEKMDEGWWLVQVGGSEGWAPSDYIKKETVTVPVPGGAKPTPPKNKPVFKPMLPTRPK